MVLTPPPLIVTLKLDQQTFNILDRMRKQYFPSQRNYLPPHVTLFHVLPGSKKFSVGRKVEGVCSQTPPLPLSLPGPRSLGRGVALEVECPGLKHLRRRLAAEWQSWLSAQDRQTFRPHITIQNKVSPEEARHLYELIAVSWVPLQAIGEGLQLWQYMGGPWEYLIEFPFRKDQE